MAKYQPGDSRAFTPQQKKNYWMKRIVDKSNSAYRQFAKDMTMVTDWAQHAGMDDQERSNLALMMADRFSAIIRRLAPQQDDEQAETNQEKPEPDATPAEGVQGIPDEPTR